MRIGSKSQVMPMNDRAARFPRLMQVRLPDNVASAVDQAAEREFTTQSEFVRRAVIAQLKERGIDPTQLQPAT
jgi:hypothetical protein